MNTRAEDTADKILLAFLDGGIVPLDLHQYAVIDAHVRSVLARAMENAEEKRERKWADVQRVKTESHAAQ